MSQHAHQGARPPLELWAGIECSVVRVGDRYHDQLERSGHAARSDDLDLIAGLGVRTLRYPVLWERTAPDGPDRADWRWPDERLGRLRALGVRPIVGLVHHGSGPRHTSLVDPSFAEGLAGFAREVARRYPWVEDYTPVNEPLTTARFSGLYGHWYPHGRDGLTFARALLNQCRGVVLAMRAVREVNPDARLVQTDDLGKVFSTARLAYQAEFENERRWLTFDLLCGKVGRGHPMWPYLAWVGVSERELGWFLDNPCPPDVVGLNYYPTSERFLDHNLGPYPPPARGGNGRHAYADVEAVRVVAGGTVGPLALLKEAWERFRLPLAITEAHLGCTREEQLRWLAEVWGEALGARDGGADVRAVTAWAVLGSFDWDSLVTRFEGHYEPAAFDLRSPRPRPTALAGMMRTLAAGGRPDHPVLGSPGWWHRPARLLYPPVAVSRRSRARAGRSEARGGGGGGRPIAIVGAAGALGQALARLCDLRGLEHGQPLSPRVDITDASSVVEALDRIKPWAVIDVGGLARGVGDGRGPEAALRSRVEGPAVLASACARSGIALVAFSSDQVFGGLRDRPHVEGDPADPRDAFGRIKAEMERRILDALPSALVIRPGAVFGPWDGDDPLTLALRDLAGGRSSLAADDEVVVSPTYFPDLVQAALDLLVDGERGLWHLANPGEATRADLARRAAELVGLGPSGVEAPPARSPGPAEGRPLRRVLGSERGVLLPTLDDALARYAREVESGWSGSAAMADGLRLPGIGDGRDGCPTADLVALPTPRG